ncbi:MAG: ABC transporter permease [Acidimicrobiales bacterium]|nr:ABC transporter permease [Acidimicrobiales bacterium]
MEDVLRYLVIFALQSAAVYAVAASGLVVTYTTTGVFNFAHGAIGMIIAFSFWQLSSSAAWDLPVLPSLLFCLFVLGPAIGWLLDRVLMSRLGGASTITTIVATIGLLVALVSIAGIVWPQSQVRRVPDFFEGESITLLDVNVSYHRIIALVAAIAVAIGLRALLFNTRLGTAMRAVVDSPDLTALNGANPRRIGSVSWMLGCSLAGLAGILIAPELPAFTPVALTLLVIQAYAAAMVGRLRSLPLTFLGALILAEIENGLALAQAKEWAGSFSPSLGDLAAAAPVLMLLIVLVVIREDRAALRPERFGFKVPRPSVASVAVSMAALVFVAAVVSVTGVFAVGTMNELGKGLALGIVMLSLVLLTGWAGQVSLAQLGLAGVAALAVWKLGPVTGLVVGVVATAVVGAIVALPALRMRSLYLALTTMAFALLLERVVYGENALVESFQPFASGNARADRIPGLEGDTAFFVFLAVVFGLVAVGLTVIRNGHFGRRLAAMKDSPAACATLGLDLTVTKLQVFALSAAIAGLGGGLLAMWKVTSVGRTDFALLEGTLPGLPLVLVAVIGGITSVTGAVVGALLFVCMPLIGSRVPALKDLMNLAPGLAGIGLSKNPDGAVLQVAEAIEEARAARADVDPLAAPERLGTDGDGTPGRITADEAALLDDELGLSWHR